MTDTAEGSAEIVKAEEYRGLQLAVAPLEAKRRLQELQAFVKEVMVEGEDYGVIPGTGTKPCLYQPGAQKLGEIYGFSHRFVAVETVKDWDRGFFYFEYKCELSSRRDGTFVGEGIGSCNSRESKYAGRWVPLGDVPPGMKAETLQKRTGSRWCFESEIPKGMYKNQLESQVRKGKKPPHNPYTVYKVVDEQYLVPNPDPYSLVNTLQKMGAKRAYVMAVIAATRSSAIFTQDLEDLPAEAFGKVEGARGWDQETSGRQTSSPDDVAAPGKAQTTAPASDPGAPAPPPGGESSLQCVTRITDLIAKASTQEQLAHAWDEERAACATGKLTKAQNRALGKLKDQRKLDLGPPPAEAPPQTIGNLDPKDLREDWGMTGPPDGEDLVDLVGDDLAGRM